MKMPPLQFATSPHSYSTSAADTYAALWGTCFKSWALKKFTNNEQACELISAWRPAGMSSVWHHSLSRFDTYFAWDGRADVLAELACFLAVSGAEFRYSFGALTHPSRILFDRYAMADVVAGEIIASGKDYLVQLVSRNRQEGRLEVRAGSMRVEGPLAGLTCIDGICVFESRGAYDEDPHVEPYVVFHAGDHVDAARNALVDALSLLRNLGSNWTAWVNDVVRYVAFSPRQDTTRTRSKSWESLAGMVSVDTGLHTTAFWTETLVHEASHQHFNFLKKFDPLVTGKDNTRYYSAATRTERPLLRILIAYHAFANVLLLYKAALEKGLWFEMEISRELYAATTLVQQLEIPLLSTDGLTETGRHVFFSLRERILS